MIGLMTVIITRLTSGIEIKERLMPKDKTESHKRVIEAMKSEFIEKGFEGASIRSIGAKAGMTSAGLYRHFKDKEAMFSSIVDPVIAETDAWLSKHKDKKYEMVKKESNYQNIFGESFIDLIKKVVIPHREEFKMLLTCAKGTKYESFIHDYVSANQQDFLDAIDFLKEQGFSVSNIDGDMLHMLLSAYVTACFEPIIHDFSDEKTYRYLKTIQEFFMPGWMNIMGMK